VRTEALGLLFIGAALFAGAVLALRAVSTPRLRGLALALAFGFTLGLGIVPAHGEVVVAPVLAFLKKGGVVSVIGALYGLAWCAVFLGAVQLYAKWRSGRAR
jgi:hypothetical protein